MKKLFDSKFLFIVALSIIVLIILGIGAFYLFNNADDTFVKSGYVINPLSAKVEKYFFNEKEEYHENLSSMVVFKDVDKNDVSILKDSFLHYNDGSLSFLTNGAILDLNTVGNGEAVNFYNITSKSIIEKDNSKYVIKTSGNDIELKNFVGRISENKYIVVGNLEAKIPGNEKNISGDYFEIVYAEEGIVNIENKNVKFQVTAEGSLIYAGNVVIDLGDKKISMDGKDMMSITAITINGDENIEIIPKAEDKKEENNDPDANGNNQNNDGDDNNIIDGNQGNAGVNDGDGNGGTGQENIINNVEDIVVSLKNAVVGSTSVDVKFDYYNNKDDDNFTLKVTNLDSGRTVYIANDIVSDEEIRVGLLSPDTKYLFTVINEKDGNKYFQKIFETNDFGIKLEKVYATDNELGFKVIIDKDTDITNAKLSLYRYNEVTKQNEIVTTSYHDNVSDEIKYSEKVTNLSSFEGNIEGVHEIIYDGLDSNTIYTAVLDDFSLASTNFRDIYNITLTAMTLKKTPEFGNMTVDKDKSSGSFKLSLGDIKDDDNAIESYTYKIYEMDNPNELAIAPITKSNASPIEVKIGDGKNELKNDVNYFYKIIIEYFDNEKYVEYIIDDTINFVMGSDPYITVVPNGKKISFDTIGATIYLTDNSCLIAMPGREKCNGTSTTRIIISSGTTEMTPRVVDFEVTESEIKYELELDGLQPGTTYSIDVEAVRSDKIDDGWRKIQHTDDSKRNITTKTLSSFTTDWIYNGSSANHVVNLQTKFNAKEGIGSLTPEESASLIKKVVVKLYNGSYMENIQSEVPIATKSFVNGEDFNIKEMFYDKAFDITTDETFGLDIDGLKAKNDGKLSEYYTLAIYGYYDEDEVNMVELTNNITSYKISPILLMENIDEPIIIADPITKRVSGMENNLINPGTVVGYMVTARFDSAGLISNGMNPTGINLYVYNDKSEKVKFYIKDGDSLSLVDEILNDNIETGSDFYQKEIFIDYGSDYGVNDDIMRRGNNYYIGYTLNIDSDGNGLVYPDNNNSNVNADFGKFTDEAIITEKETPTVTMYIAKSTNNSITYRYTVKDPDNALYRENTDASYGYYYTINNGDEHKLSLTFDSSVSAYHSFSGEFTINGLSNNDLYSLYYKKNVSKTGNYDADIKNYFDGSDNGNRLFDGYYDFKEEKYNFNYEVINNPLSDNKVTIKILMDEDVLDRVVDYKVTFRDSKNNDPLVKDIWKLVSCDGDDEEETPRCFSVDYVELKNAGMKSDKNSENIITVSIEAYYDNGLTGYDYTVGNDKDYKYMIFQNNLVPGVDGSYVAFAKGGNVTNWSDALDIGKGYYTYTKGARSITYTSILARKTNSISFNLTSSGYSSSYGILNPKMISVDMMNSTKKTFSFSSITPKVAVNKTTRLINGAAVDISLSGADLDDFCENENGGRCINTDDSEFYLYVDVWISPDVVGEKNQIQRPTVKVKIDKNNPASSIRATLDGLFTERTYYYNIYAYLNKNGISKYTQLFDIGFKDRYEVKTYNFSTLSVNELFHNFEASYKPNMNGAYSDKLLTTKINLIAYENDVPFNFDMGYAFCELDDSNCGLKEENTNIFKSMIEPTKIKTTTIDTVDISDKVNSQEIEFNKTYWNLIFVIFDYYESPNNLTKYYLKINRRNDGLKLKALDIPEFIVSREANYVDGEYVLDFTINVKDMDRVLNDGKYYVSLKDSSGNVVGNLQVKDDDGNYVTVASNGEYIDYDFDATITNKSLRITGLNADSKYTIEVYNDAFINNYSETIPKEERTITVSKKHTVYTVNNSGVAFGKDLLFTATQKTFIVTFLGGSKFDNVREVGYTVGLWDDDSSTSSATYSGSYTIGENNKRFELFKDIGDWKFIIDDSQIDNELGQTYTVALSFRVVDGENEYYYDSITNPEFAGKAQYAKDNE